jgi:hypothetical protein
VASGGRSCRFAEQRGRLVLAHEIAVCTTRRQEQPRSSCRGQVDARSTPGRMLRSRQGLGAARNHPLSRRDYAGVGPRGDVVRAQSASACADRPPARVDNDAPSPPQPVTPAEAPVLGRSDGRMSQTITAEALKAMRQCCDEMPAHGSGSRGRCDASIAPVVAPVPPGVLFRHGAGPSVRGQAPPRTFGTSQNGADASVAAPAAFLSMIVDDLIDRAIRTPAEAFRDFPCPTGCSGDCRRLQMRRDTNARYDASSMRVFDRRRCRLAK